MADPNDRRPQRPEEAVLGTGRLPPTTSVAVSPHHLASQAALDIMGRGGNAVDGAIAANAVLGVVAPDTCGVGGDLFAIVHHPDADRPLALNASGRAGSGTTAEELRGAGLDHIPAGSPWSISIPGCVDGWTALIERLGNLTLSGVLEPAVVYAVDGFPVSAELARSLERIQDRVAGQSSSPPLYPDGAPPAPGMIIRRPHLGATMQTFANEGRDAFYLGQVGHGITAATEGAIQPVDMEADQAEWVEPLQADVYEHTAWTIPPNTQGYLTLAASWIIEQLGPPPDPADPDYIHYAIEAYRAVAHDRDDVVSDPATAPLAAELLVAPERLRPRLAAIRKDAVASWSLPRPAPGGTAFFCTKDASGMGVSIIQSNFHGIGSGRSAGGTGVFLHDRGAGFNLEQGHPNEYTPGRRPLHTLAPTLWTIDGKLALILGTRGGEFQPQLLTQMAAHLMLACDGPTDAQDRPRWLVDGWAAGDEPTVRVESRLEDSVIEDLRSRGHTVVTEGPWMEGFGPISVIRTDEQSVEAAADPRVSTSAALAETA